MAGLVGNVLILLGAFFHFAAGVGLLRMPDAYTRMQAATKAPTLGNTLVLLGIAFHHPGWALKLVVLIYFVLMTNPISAHAVARAAYRIGVPIGPPGAVDALREAGRARRGDA
jgi:multicomponent Na+:H+ antiporter subunit G